ncbi:helix-turn-helix transcriptional regulator [Nocardioides litoris]|uniref:helix-turn-helix transcriptional regulator n=1 Tax=Nocardioides litoris TaxID=1926648 RepID=UPI0011211884|nr:response regulator transcription factor [Nocardioides litoris]
MRHPRPSFLSLVTGPAAAAPTATVDAPVDDAPPVRVSLEVPALLAAGVTVLLRPYADRVRIVPRHGPEVPDVEVLDPALARTVDGNPAGAGPDDLPAVPRVALVWESGSAAVARARDLGAVAMVPVSAGAEALVEALERVHRRDPLVDPDAPAPGGLSPREADVLRGICRGQSNLEIAEELYVSINSVKTYVRSAYRKMGVSSRSQAVLWGLEHGL